MTAPDQDPQQSTAPDFLSLPWPRTTDRLVIRPATAEDGDALWEFWRLPEVGMWLGWAPVDRSDWEATYPAKRADFLVVEHEGRVIGNLMLQLGDGWGQREVADQAVKVQAEIGWVFHPDSGGRGLATEAVEDLLALCFVDLGLRRVEAGAFADNEPSWRLMERAGMRRESYSVRESLHRELGWIDGVLYAMLAEEWRAHSSRGDDSESAGRSAAAS